MGGTCTSCGAMISTGSPICASCGAPQRPAGSGSSTQNQPNHGGFCGSCGTRLISKYSPCPDCGHVKTTFNPQPDPGNPNPYGGNPNPIASPNALRALAAAGLSNGRSLARGLQPSGGLYSTSLLSQGESIVKSVM